MRNKYLQLKFFQSREAGSDNLLHAKRGVFLTIVNNSNEYIVSLFWYFNACIYLKNNLIVRASIIVLFLFLLLVSANSAYKLPCTTLHRDFNVRFAELWKILFSRIALFWLVARTIKKKKKKLPDDVYLHTTLSGMYERDTAREKELDIALQMTIEHVLTQRKTLDKEHWTSFC